MKCPMKESRFTGVTVTPRHTPLQLYRDALPFVAAASSLVLFTAKHKHEKLRFIPS